mmetsp:Transcript_32468/g.52816  ORF Transcript_32468/g.52816 Transcript_32468/m.52816 type:complete len:89 (+) Transcript_32468:227-493(+)
MSQSCLSVLFTWAILGPADPECTQNSLLQGGPRTFRQHDLKDSESRATPQCLRNDSIASVWPNRCTLPTFFQAGVMDSRTSVSPLELG